MIQEWKELCNVKCYDADGDQKVWSQNKGESKVREMKSPNYFTIVH